MKKKICMVVPNESVKGGIAAVVNGYRGSRLEQDFDILYVQSYVDGNKAQKLLKAIGGYISFLKVLCGNRIDVVHIHSSFGPSFYRKLPFIWMASMAKIPIINHIHGADFTSFYVNASVGKKRLIHKVYEKCSIIIALSDEWRENLSQIVPREKIAVIENYSILHEEAMGRKRKKEEPYQVLFLGEIGERKGCFDIPYVVKDVVKEVPNVVFVLGGVGKIDEVMQLARKCHCSDYITFPGWVVDKKKDKLLKESDLFFLPSYNEGMPMSILDAMGYGLPVVSTNVGGIPKIVQNQRNGASILPGDKEGFAKNIIEILTHEEKRVAYGKESYEVVKKQYSLDSHINRLEQIYSYISKKRGKKYAKECCKVD